MDSNLEDVHLTAKIIGKASSLSRKLLPPHTKTALNDGLDERIVQQFLRSVGFHRHRRLLDEWTGDEVLSEMALPDECLAFDPYGPSTYEANFRSLYWQTVSLAYRPHADDALANQQPGQISEKASLRLDTIMRSIAALQAFPRRAIVMINSYHVAQM